MFVHCQLLEIFSPHSQYLHLFGEGLFSGCKDLLFLHAQGSQECLKVSLLQTSFNQWLTGGGRRAPVPLSYWDTSKYDPHCPQSLLEGWATITVCVTWLGYTPLLGFLPLPTLHSHSSAHSSWKYLLISHLHTNPSLALQTFFWETQPKTELMTHWIEEEEEWIQKLITTHWLPTAWKKQEQERIPFWDVYS